MGRGRAHPLSAPGTAASSCAPWQMTAVGLLLTKCATRSSTAASRRRYSGARPLHQTRPELPVLTKCATRSSTVASRRRYKGARPCDAPRRALGAEYGQLPAAKYSGARPLQ
jgi:hypothetical protein